MATKKMILFFLFGWFFVFKDCHRILSSFYGHNYNIDICFLTLGDSLSVLQKYQKTIINILCVCIRLKVTIVALIKVFLHSGTKQCSTTHIIKHLVPFCESIGLQGHHVYGWNGWCEFAKCSKSYCINSA
jgi:hypothetical protein